MQICTALNSVPSLTDLFGEQVYPGPQVQKPDEHIESLPPGPALTLYPPGEPETNFRLRHRFQHAQAS